MSCRGAYMGTLSLDRICAAPDKALFWDTVHPTTLTRCRQAWKVGTAMAVVGWIDPLSEPSDYLRWCREIVGRVTLGPVKGFAP